MSELLAAPPAALTGSTRAAVGILLFATVATTAYWVAWYGGSREALATLHTPAYYAFENAFPLADGWMALTSLLAALALLARKPQALLWMLLAGSAGVYLACMDLLFDLENKVFVDPSVDRGSATVEGLIIALTLAGGVWMMVFAWRNRRALLQEGS